LTATAVIEAFGVVVVLNGGISFEFMPRNILVMLISSPVILVLTCVLTGGPAAMAVWLSEKFRVRSLLFYGCAGGAIGALSQTLLFRTFSPLSWIFVLAGFLAGLDYWSRENAPVLIEVCRAMGRSASRPSPRRYV
jgi:hypothetical protein